MSSTAAAATRSQRARPACGGRVHFRRVMQRLAGVVFRRQRAYVHSLFQPLEFETGFLLTDTLLRRLARPVSD